MSRAIQEPQGLLIKIFYARLTELINYLPIFPVSSAADKMDPE